jgi:AcrR family transcriptional regulator
MTDPTSWAETSPQARLGRPRRFEPDVERTMLLDACIRVMVASGFAATSVSDVLNDAGLSTRSFYRHFETKDDLVAAVVRREAGAVHDWLNEAIGEASGALEGFAVWLDCTLDLFFDRRRSERTALFATPEVVRASRIPEELIELRRLVFDPLTDILRSGHRSGTLHSPTPELDAMTIFELVSASARNPAARKRGRAAVRRHVLRYAGPALGLS